MPSNDEQKKIYAKRFNIALDLYGVPQKNQGRALVVSDMFGLTQRGAARWVNGEVLPPKARRKEIPEKLQVDFKWLEFGHGEPKESFHAGQTRAKSFPVITQFESRDHKRVLSSFAGRRMTFDTDASNDSFVVDVVGKAMSPVFTPGTLLLVDPNAEVKDGLYVLVFVYQLNEVLFRQYRLGDSETHLVPTNPEFNSIPFSNRDEIIGVAVEMKQVLK